MLIQVDEATAAQRRVYFHLVDATDGITAETGENGEQPQISSDGAAWTNTGIGTLTAVGNGRYYADLTAGAVDTVGTVIETRYKSANTAESPGDTARVVSYDPNAGNSVIVVSPLSSTVSAGVVSESNLLAYQFAAFAGYTWVIVDSEGEPVDLLGKAIKFQAYDPNDVATQLWTETGSVGGDDNNQVTINGDDSNTGEAGAFRYVMRNTTDDSVIAKGVLTIVALPDVS
jgi:hypothetical protein